MTHRSLSLPVLAAALLLAAPAAATAQRALAGDPLLVGLRPGQAVHGFTARALYLDGADRPMGARFVHDRTRMTVDVLHQQTVPQAFVWVTTYPTSNKGEPHTQEHLLVGKGPKGRALATYELSALASSTAFTEQFRTAYGFSTAAGPRAFYTLVEQELDAYIRPDYTDEEIRREVRNFGVADDPATKSLRLEEKGSVYNEMVTSTSSSGGRAYRTMLRMVYGDHPMSRNAGGDPEGIREMGVEDIRAFHEAHYRLSNMGIIAAVPDEMPASQVLRRFAAMFDRLQGTAPVQPPPMTASGLPAPKATTAGAIQVAAYPHRNAQQPSPVFFAFPATRTLDVREQALIELFVQAFSDDPTANLYKKFVDTRTRALDVGATAAFGGVIDGQGTPVYFGLNGVRPSSMTHAELATMRAAIVDELRRVAALPDGSPELAEFNARVRSRVVSNRRQLSKFVSSPPRFGARGTFGTWIANLDQLNETASFRKSLVYKDELRFADSLAALTTNAWRTYLPKWGLTTVEPYVAAARPDPALIEKDAAERTQRAAAELARLRAALGAADDQDAILRYRAEYDRNTASLDSAARSAPPIRLVDDLPMTHDDRLRYAVATVAGVPVLQSTFESMTGHSAGLALRLDVIPQDRLVYAAALPPLLTRVGVIRDGVPMSFDVMSERLRREILSLNATFSTNPKTGRAELVVRGAGNDAAEGRRALGWMRLALSSPDWRPENLPRIRDVIDQTLAGLRQTQQGSPESWVNGVASSYRWQESPLALATGSLHARTHYMQRLRWLLRDPGAPAERQAVDGWLTRVAGAAQSGTRADLQALLRAVQDSSVRAPESLAALATEARGLAGPARALAVDASRDLAQSLADLPDETLRDDWSYLATQIRLDLAVPPAAALAALDSVRARLLVAGNARGFVVGATDVRAAVAPALRELLGTLRPGRAAPATYASRRVIDERLRARANALAGAPTFVGLLDPNMQGGVMMNSAPLAGYGDTSRTALTRFLASKLYGGGGSHSVFSKTIAAGLAYSNGIGSSPTSGLMTYYAERTPELPQTLSFVIDDVVKATRPDTGLVDYALAIVFNGTRAADAFEDRTEAMSNDLADGVRPELVRDFRRRLLALERTPSLGAALFAEKDSVYASVLPGYVRGMPDRPGAVYFVIGAERQFAAYERFLRSAVAPDAALHRLYPRDFWVTLPAAEVGRTQP